MVAPPSSPLAQKKICSSGRQVYSYILDSSIYWFTLRTAEVSGALRAQQSSL